MIKNFFKRRGAPETATPGSASATQASTPPPAALTSVAERRHVPRPLPVGQVIEGNGGDIEWGLWNEAVRKAERPDAFAPTELSPLRPK